MKFNSKFQARERKATNKQTKAKQQKLNINISIKANCIIQMDE